MLSLKLSDNTLKGDTLAESRYLIIDRLLELGYLYGDTVVFRYFLVSNPDKGHAFTDRSKDNRTELYIYNVLNRYMECEMNIFEFYILLKQVYGMEIYLQTKLLTMNRSTLWLDGRYFYDMFFGINNTFLVCDI
jgi:hypothetical protein